MSNDDLRDLGPPDESFDRPIPPGADLSVSCFTGPMQRAMRRNQQQNTLKRMALALLMGALAATAAAEEAKIDFQLLPPPRNIRLSEGHSNTVIRSTQEWIDWLGNLPDGVENLPTIDFERYTVLVINAGYRTNGPFEIKIESITDTGNEIRVQVSVTGPAPCPRAPEAGQYFAIVLIPQTDKPIHFNMSSRGSDCSRK